MRILVGCEMTYDFQQVTPVIATLNVHASRVSDLERPDYLITTPSVPLEGYRDSFGNWCNRFVAPAGRFTLKTDTVVRDQGSGTRSIRPRRIPIENLPVRQLLFLLGSRYCETDRLSRSPGDLFGGTPPGLAPGAGHLRLRPRPHPLRLRALAPDPHRRRTLRGAAGRLPRLRPSGDRLLPLPQHPGALLHGLHQRHRPSAAHAPATSRPGSRSISAAVAHLRSPQQRSRIGRILIAFGRDAADVPLTLTFGQNTLLSFQVTTEQLGADEPA